MNDTISRAAALDAIRAWIDSNGEWNTEDFTLDKEEDREDEPIAWMPLPEPYEAERREG